MANRDNLIRSDLESASKLSVLDEHNDWYDLSKNMWLTEEERNYASRQVLREKQVKEEMEEGTQLNIMISGN